MKHSANDTAQQHSSSNTNKLNSNAARKQILTVPLPDPITKNIEAITSFQTQENRSLPIYQQLLETIASFFSHSIFLYLLLLLLILWIGSSFFDSLLPFHLPPFSWSSQGLDAAALLISTGVLVRQTRQENFAEQRTQLMLQLNLLSEQKIAKMIALLEELRTDLPDVVDRTDPEAEVMQEPADPIAVLEALEGNLAQELALETEAEQ
ncbi:MAG: DUF1003 domain-containing protein [Cyanosarcina radialis HA8281-LM2]|jgi:uncharacterized membrane protein|nr:DUF1003 domain-containing protein [Cyanosarcina radialis HA8281-LM2]